MRYFLKSLVSTFGKHPLIMLTYFNGPKGGIKLIMQHFHTSDQRNPQGYISHVSLLYFHTRGTFKGGSKCSKELLSRDTSECASVYI